jgi:hypothetical protein
MLNDLRGKLAIISIKFFSNYAIISSSASLKSLIAAGRLESSLLTSIIACEVSC